MIQTPRKKKPTLSSFNSETAKALGDRAASSTSDEERKLATLAPEV